MTSKAIMKGFIEKLLPELSFKVDCLFIERTAVQGLAVTAAQQTEDPACYCHRAGSNAV